MSDHVKCPYCKESVRSDAAKCKHCQSYLVPDHMTGGMITAFFFVVVIVGFIIFAG